MSYFVFLSDMIPPPTPDWEGVPPPGPPQQHLPAIGRGGYPPRIPSSRFCQQLLGGGYPPHTPSDPQQQLLIFIDFQWFSLNLIDTMTPATPTGDPVPGARLLLRLHFFKFFDVFCLFHHEKRRKCRKSGLVCSSTSFFQVFAFFIPDVNKISSSFSCRFFLS